MTHDPVSSADLFHCKTCGDCCTGYGGTYVTEKDVEAIAAFLNLDKKVFIESCCQLSGNRPLIRSGSDEKCIFFHPEQQCTIHPVKPRMCRA